jgi:hypothetical protein
VVAPPEASSLLPESPFPDSPFPDSPFPDSPAPDSPAPDSPAPDSPADFAARDFPADEDAARSFFAQPEPLKWTAGVVNPLRMAPSAPQAGQNLGAPSWIPWITSVS